MADAFDMLRSFGKDVGAAIASRGESKYMRRKMEEEEEDLRRRRRRESREEDLQKKNQEEILKRGEHREKATELLRQGKAGTPDFMAEAFASGVPLSTLMPKQGGPKGPKRYEAVASTADAMVTAVNKKLGDLYSNIASKSDAGDVTPEDLEVLNKTQEGYKKMLTQMVDMDKDMLSTDFARISQNKDQVLSTYDNAKIALLDAAVSKKIEKLGKQAKETEKRLSDYTSELTPYADLSGVPSTSDFNRVAQGAIKSGKISKDQMLAILSSSPDELNALMEDEETPQVVQDMALSLLKNATAAEFVANPEKMEKQRKKTVFGKLPKHLR